MFIFPEDLMGTVGMTVSLVKEQNIKIYIYLKYFSDPKWMSYKIKAGDKVILDCR